ncbi:hypothetical protein EVAR_72069_1 [Eumeta japonica]|uniref:Uncharacterized protein n=1 Tax=Eumeta variegata TaxID=151549 RepID=A0A4C2ABL0_EUMVA|nr:hypothetical protein EVAR_72069_1 [Eumeta japonica]
MRIERERRGRYSVDDLVFIHTFIGPYLDTQADSPSTSRIDKLRRLHFGKIREDPERDPEGEPKTGTQTVAHCPRRRPCVDAYSPLYTPLLLTKLRQRYARHYVVVLYVSSKLTMANTRLRSDAFVDNVLRIT